MHTQQFSLRQYTSVWLFVVLAISLAQTRAESDDLLAISTGVELKESNYRGISQLYGELNLGDISAGSKITATFDIINKSANSIELHGIKPSCSCVDLKIVSGVLMPDSKLARMAEANLTVPQAMGKNVVVGEIAISDKSGSAYPVATVCIRANILRPFLLKERRVSISLFKDEDVSFSIPFDLDPNTMADQISIQNSLHGKSETKILREGPTRGVVRVLGKREELLRAESMAIGISMNHMGTKIEDLLQVDFLDGTKARVAPTVVPAIDGKLQFVVFCLNGIDNQKLRVFDESEALLASNVVGLTKSASRVSLDLGKGRVPKSIVITDDKFKVSVSVEVE